MHVLFHINPTTSKCIHPMMDYSDCIKSLMKTEVSPALLAQCDGIVFEGSGLILSQLCTIPDQAMKHPMNNALKMGVKLVISN